MHELDPHLISPVSPLHLPYEQVHELGCAGACRMWRLGSEEAEMPLRDFRRMLGLLPPTVTSFAAAASGAVGGMGGGGGGGMGGGGEWVLARVVDFEWGGYTYGVEIQATGKRKYFLPESSLRIPAMFLLTAQGRTKAVASSR